MHVWARVALRLSERELEAWPLGRADLEPYYERAEAFMGVEPVARTPRGGGVRRAGRARSGSPRCRWRPEKPGVFSPLDAAHATGRLTLRPDSVVRA